MLAKNPLSACALVLALLAGACSPARQAPEIWPDEIISLHVGQAGWVLTSHGLYGPDRTAVPLPASERDHRLSAAWVDDEAAIWIGTDMGRVYRTLDGGRTWQAAMTGFEVPDMVLIDLSLRRPVPREFLRLEDGSLYLATIGRGVMVYDETAETWRDASWAFDLEGAANPLAWTMVPAGRGLVAAFVEPRGMVPPEYTGIFGLALRDMARPGEAFSQRDLPAGVRLVTDLARRGGQTLVASLGHGLWQSDGEGWSQLWSGEPPADLWAVDVDAQDRIAAITLGGDVWLLDGGAWRRIHCGGQGRPGADVRFDGRRVLAAVGDEVLRLPPKEARCPERGGARVMLAFSQHTNFYHSYRGDTDGEDGFGKDMRIIRNTLDLFDARPGLHNDWDIENLFSLDGWMPEYCPDILDDISRRVEDGTDGIRLMSWNNGLMACEPADEFALSVSRAVDSLQSFTPGLWVPGVQPQENTYTPAHPALYRQLGIQWITLFYSATSFTGFRAEIPLSLAEAHGVLTLASALSDETMTLLPVFHHADVMEHGGLANWLRQLHQNLDGTAVLAIHFDADGDTWLGFGAELDDVLAMDADWVEPVRLQDVIATVVPGATVQIERDMADGAFDGFSSWTEKPVNHRFYTRVIRSRIMAEAATGLAAGSAVAGLAEALDAAKEARLRTLSTTHFGLATPALHPEREAAGDLVSSEAEQQAAAGLALAAVGRIDPGRQVAYNPAPVERLFLQPVAGALADEAGQIRSLASPDGSRTWLSGTLPAGDIRTLVAATPQMQEGPTPPTAWAPPDLDLAIGGPRLRFDGLDTAAVIDEVQTASGEGGQVWTVTGSWPVGQGGSVRYDWIRLEDDPDGWWLSVDIRYPSFDEADLRWWEEAVPVEIGLPAADAWVVRRLLVTGELASFPISEPADALNNQAADGWLGLVSADAASGVSVTSYTPLRAAPAFAPLRIGSADNGGLDATVAPFAALWGELFDHRSRALLGTGLGEYVTRLVSPQIQSSAPAWNGTHLCFLLRLESGDARPDLASLRAARDGVILFDAGGEVMVPEGCF